MFDKNSVIGIILIVIVMYLFVLPSPQRFTEDDEVQDVENRESLIDGSTGKMDTLKRSRTQYIETGEADDIFFDQDELEFIEYGDGTEIIVNTSLYRGYFSSLGGCVTGWEVKDYPDYSTGGPVRLLEKNQGCGGSVKLFESGNGIDLAKLDFSVNKNELDLEISRADRDSLVFKYELPDGTNIERIYRFDNYLRAVQAEIRRTGIDGGRGRLAEKLEFSWEIPVIPTEKNKKDDRYYFSAMVCNDYMVNKRPLKKFSKVDTWELQSKVYWIGLTTKYFLTAFIPDEEMRDIDRNVRFKKKSPDKDDTDIAFKTAFNLPDDTFGYALYFGPLEDEELRIVGSRLETARQLTWAWLNPISDILLWFMNLLHGIIPNYGIVIIILSVIVKAIFWPLMKKQYQSMAAMRKIQPEMTKLKEKYKSDPPRMNKEVMKLYKEHKVNPLGGCLPMLIQFPVMIALYQVFRGTIELRGEGFIFYITDLSAKDPYYILPVLMGVSMFIQQKMTIQDPKQMAMVYMMPVLFTFLFMNFPSGLVLYWLTVNIISIFQQSYADRMKPAESIKTQ